MNRNLWNINDEIDFFKNALHSFASKEKLFYRVNDKYYSYFPKTANQDGQTLNARNALIGHYTEKWCQKLLSPIAAEFGLYAVNGVVCEEIALIKNSAADLAFCTTPENIQKPENIKLIFEIKMSIVSNYQYYSDSEICYVGDYTTHKGNPSILRSDSMLKAIGKAINIRVSGIKSAQIPIIILGNSPITHTYIKKVDFLKSNGVIQHFLSLNPESTKHEHIIKSPKEGFLTIDKYQMLEDICKKMLSSEMYYFSSMMEKNTLGKIILESSKELTDTDRADKFFSLIYK